MSTSPGARSSENRPPRTGGESERPVGSRTQATDCAGAAGPRRPHPRTRTLKIVGSCAAVLAFASFAGLWLAPIIRSADQETTALAPTAPQGHPLCASA